MFIYVEKFPATGAVDKVMQLVLSTNGRDTFINWKNKQEEATINMLRSLFKQIPIAEWTYDDKTHVWSFIGYRGDVLLAGLESFISQGVLRNVEIIEIEELEKKAEYGQLNRKSTPKTEDQKKFKDEDFFYSNTQPVSSNEPSGAELNSKIAVLLEVGVVDLTNLNNTELKKLYRRAALKYHPDRNNGDGSKMSELNYLWNIYMSKGV